MFAFRLRGNIFLCLLKRAHQFGQLAVFKLRRLLEIISPLSLLNLAVYAVDFLLNRSNTQDSFLFRFPLVAKSFLLVLELSYLRRDCVEFFFGRVIGLFV